MLYTASDTKRYHSSGRKSVEHRLLCCNLPPKKRTDNVTNKILSKLFDIRTKRITLKSDTLQPS